jgi:hypothetical protein
MPAVTFDLQAFLSLLGFALSMGFVMALALSA